MQTKIYIHDDGEYLLDIDFVSKDITLIDDTHRICGVSFDDSIESIEDAINLFVTKWGNNPEWDYCN